MRKHHKAILAVLALLVLGTYGYARTNYTGYSGAPGSDGNCASSCHGSSGGTIEISGFPTEYFPGQAYTVTISHNGGSSINQFNGSCRVGSGSVNAGTIVSMSNTATYNTSGETNGIRLSSSNQSSGTFSWTAPAGGTGQVVLYVSGHQGTSASGANTQLALVSNELATDVQDDGSQEVPGGFVLKDNYPNPFNPSTAIAFDLPQRSHITVEIFNLLGQRVATLVDEERAAGSYEVTWNGESSSGQVATTGVYFYRLQAGEFVDTKKMLLLK